MRSLMPSNERASGAVKSPASGANSFPIRTREVRSRSKILICIRDSIGVLLKCCEASYRCEDAAPRRLKEQLSFAGFCALANADQRRTNANHSSPLPKAGDFYIVGWNQLIEVTGPVTAISGVTCGNDSVSERRLN